MNPIRMAVAIALCAAAPAALAFGVPGISGTPGLGGHGPAPIGMGTQIVGLAHNAPFPVASPQYLSLDSSWTAATIGTQIQQATAANIASQAKNTTAITKSMNAQTRLLYDQMQRQFAAKQAVRRTNTFSPALTYNHPLDGCAAPGVGTSAFQGAVNERQVINAESAGDTAYEHSTNTATANTTRVLAIQKTATTPATLFPKNGTMTAQEITAARQYTQLVIDPNPPILLTSKQAATPAGRRYNADRRTRNARVQLAQRVMDQIIADKSPTVPSDGWAKGAWSSMGHSGQPPGIVHGDMSSDAMLTLMVQSRFGNANWYAHVLAGENKIGVLRDMAVMQAISMQIQLERLKLQQLTAAITAAKYAASVETSATPTLSTQEQAAANEAAR